MSDFAGFWIGLAIVIVGFWYIGYLDHRDTILRDYATCIAATAKAEGYKGNAYGPEAYDLFIDSCR